jgi:cell division protein FtsQ
MSTRRKISVRKILQFCVTLVAITGFVLAMTAAARRHESRRITGTDLRITNPRASHFLDKDALEDMLFTRRHINPKKLKLESVDLRRLEKLARTNPWVANAQAHVDHRRVLHVRVTQRVPVVRLFGRDGSSHYLDTALKTLPVSVGYAHYIPVVTGVPSLSDDSAGRAMKGKIIGLVNRISRDSFWNAQVAEIAVSPDGRGFELVPVLGSHRILLGDTSRLDAKLNGLLSFYKGVLNRVGWDKYTTLDVRYRGQVVASPALQWKAPVDRAATNMNWVKTILGDGPPTVGATPNPSVSASAPSAVPLQAAQSVSPSPTPAAAPQTRPSLTPATRPAATQQRRTNTTPPARPSGSESVSARRTTTARTSTVSAPATRPVARPKSVTGGAATRPANTPKPAGTTKPKYVLPSNDN